MFVVHALIFLLQKEGVLFFFFLMEKKYEKRTIESKLLVDNVSEVTAPSERMEIMKHRKCHLKEITT